MAPFNELPYSGCWFSSKRRNARSSSWQQQFSSSVIKAIHPNFLKLFVVHIFYSPSCFGQEIAKVSFLEFESVSTCPPVYYTRRKLHTVLFIAKRQTGNLWIPIFYSLWFDPTRNRTLVYRFRSKHFILSNTDRLFVQITFSAKPFSQSTPRSSPPWSCLGSCYIDILAMCVCVLLRD